MLKSFYSDPTQEEEKGFAEKVSDLLKNKDISMAALVKFFVYNREYSARECIDKMDQYASDGGFNSDELYLYSFYSL